MLYIHKQQILQFVSWSSSFTIIIKIPWLVYNVRSKFILLNCCNIKCAKWLLSEFHSSPSWLLEFPKENPTLYALRAYYCHDEVFVRGMGELPAVTCWSRASSPQHFVVQMWLKLESDSMMLVFERKYKHAVRNKNSHKQWR